MRKINTQHECGRTMCFDFNDAVPVQNGPVLARLIARPTVLLLAAFSIAAHSNGFTLGTILPWVLSDTAARCSACFERAELCGSFLLEPLIKITSHSTPFLGFPSKRRGRIWQNIRLLRTEGNTEAPLFIFWLMKRLYGRHPSTMQWPSEMQIMNSGSCSDVVENVLVLARRALKPCPQSHEAPPPLSTPGCVLFKFIIIERFVFPNKSTLHFLGSPAMNASRVK